MDKNSTVGDGDTKMVARQTWEGSQRGEPGRGSEGRKLQSASPQERGKEAKERKSNRYKVAFSSVFSCLLTFRSESPVFPLWFD